MRPSPNVPPPERIPPRTPLVKRLPNIIVLVIAFVLARLAGHTVWLGLLIFVATVVVGILILHFVFGQPLSRLIRYEEPPED